MDMLRIDSERKNAKMTKWSHGQQIYICSMSLHRKEFSGRYLMSFAKPEITISCELSYSCDFIEDTGAPEFLNKP